MKNKAIIELIYSKPEKTEMTTNSSIFDVLSSFENGKNKETTRESDILDPFLSPDQESFLYQGDELSVVNAKTC